MISLESTIVHGYLHVSDELLIKGMLRVDGGIIGNLIGNADTATALETSRTISLSGDLSGSASFDGSADITITATVADNSHNHVISNIDGLQTALDNKTVNSLNDIGDVNIVSPADGESLVWNATAGEWQAGMVSGTVNSYFEFSRAPYAPHVEFEFEFVAHGNPGYAFPPLISVGLEYDPLVQHDGSFPSPPNITPVIGLITQEISGILRYRGFTVHWVGNVVPETLPNTYVSAIAMIPKQ